MRWRCPNQSRRRCRSIDDAVGCLVRSRMLWLLPEHTQEAPLTAHVEEITSRRRRSARVVSHASEP